MEKNFDEILAEAAMEIGVSLNNEQLSRFTRYYFELLTWNRKMNLVSVKSSLDLPIKHFIDSLTPLPYLMNPSARLLDIGTGAGFPGLPMKIAMPSLMVFLLESSRKKTSFLKHIIRTLGLDNTTVIHNRIEYVMANDTYRNAFDIMISRATFKLPVLLRIGAFFLAGHGIVIAMKGEQSAEEMKEALTLCDTLGFFCLPCQDVRLPVIHDRRKIILFKKAPNTTM